MHHAGLPTPNVNVANLFLGDFIAVWCLGRPNVKADAVVHTVNHLTSVFRAIFVCHVAFTRFFVEGPVTSVTAGIVGINLNSEAMAHFGDVGVELFRNQKHVLNNQW